MSTWHPTASLAALGPRVRDGWAWLRPLLAAFAVTVWTGLRAVLYRLRYRLARMLRCALSLPYALAAMHRWPKLCASCGLGRMVNEPGSKARAVVIGTPRRRRVRLTPCGYCLRVRPRNGQSIEDVRAAIPKLRAGLRGEIRVQSVHAKPHLVDVVVLRRDPFRKVPRPVALSSTLIRLGRVETGDDWLIDFEARPHGLVSGATGSGKTGVEAALLAALAPTDAAVALIDLKHGVAAEPYRARASLVATTPDTARDLLADLLRLGEQRAEFLRAHHVGSVYDLPHEVQPREVYVLVDEVAEIAMRGSSRETKQIADQAEENLLRTVQLLRAFGVHVIIAGQRFGATMGRRITDIRAQLSVRVALRCEDAETADMTVGDIAREAVDASTQIPEWSQGVAVASGGVDRWQRVRASYISPAQLRTIAAEHSDKRVPWHSLVASQPTGDGELARTQP